MGEQTFKVIIVGGSIAGLTLAHCLERIGIDYLVLEKASEIAPQVGASIGVFPNGARILDQLGIYGDLEEVIEPMGQATVCYPDGFSFSSSYPQIIHKRFQYPIAFLDRQKLLEILYTKLPDRSKIRLRSRVASITTLRDNGGVNVTTDDAQTYTGHLVVGADGVHSRVRSEMWKAAQSDGRGPTAKEQQGMTTEYCCIFGISSAVKGLNVGEQVNAFYDHLTIMTVHGRKGRIYWFFIQKLDQRYIYPDNPNYGPEHATLVAERFRHRRLCNDITFGHVWDNREIATITPLEEGLFQTWYHGRIVLMGDSVHKMTPNLGQGANMAIEDAASLASLLNNLLDGGDGQRLTREGIEAMLRQYRDSRYSRVRAVYNTSRFLVRFQARNGLFNTLFGRYYAPYAGDLPADIGSKTIAGAEVCSFLPIPSSADAWDRYRSRGWRESIGAKEVFGLVIIIGLALQYFGPIGCPGAFCASSRLT
nr:FAD-dependent monooxygenase [Aspergillus striatus]